MEERRRGFIDLAEKLSGLEVNTEKRLARLEVSVEKVEEDLKDIKKVLEKLSDKLNLAEDEIWQDLDNKSKTFNERLKDLENNKLKNKSILTGIAIAAGAVGNTAFEKLLKLLS